ncbi:MAG: hypothetical protein ACPL28_09740 [bacterium]
MNGYVNAILLYTGIVYGLKFNYNSPLESFVINSVGDKLAYVDNRRDAKLKCNFDLWGEMKKEFKKNEFKNWIKSQNISEHLLYSKSEQFPDFIFKVKIEKNNLAGGEILELKDSKGGSIASFNSTLPTIYKSLEEIDIINGNNLVSKIVSLIDKNCITPKGYYSFHRRNFYLVRTHKDDQNKIKISIVDGSFFETVPKDHLIYQVFLNIWRAHILKKDIKIPPDLLNEIEKSLAYINDQTIIASSQIIEKASIRPRLRIMAEVHSEGNPHSSFYPEIQERSVNFIIKSGLFDDQVRQLIIKEFPDTKHFKIRHKRNGEHLVFQIKI